MFFDRLFGERFRSAALIISLVFGLIRWKKKKIQYKKKPEKLFSLPSTSSCGLKIGTMEKEKKRHDLLSLISSLSWRFVRIDVWRNVKIRSEIKIDMKKCFYLKFSHRNCSNFHEEKWSSDICGVKQRHFLFPPCPLTFVSLIQW